MTIRIFVLVAILTVASSSAFAQGSKGKQPEVARAGTADDQAACRPAVRRYCNKLVDESDLVILACLQEHRKNIGKACNEVLVRNGQ
jgi:hypothetical protein